MVKQKVLDELYVTVVSVRPFEQWIQKVNFIYPFYAFPCRKRTLPSGSHPLVQRRACSDALLRSEATNGHADMHSRGDKAI